MKSSREFTGALGIAAVAISLDFASGRAPAAFYGQMGGASWLGVGLSALLFGLFTGLVSALARRTGAASFFGVLQRLPGGSAGTAVMAIYGSCLALAACMLAASAAHAGALVLPVRHAAWISAGMALLSAAAIALSPENTQRRIGAFLAAAMTFYELLLMLHAVLPQGQMLHYELELRLENNWIAAVLFSLVHTSACLCISSGAAVQMSGGRMRPAALGTWSGLIFGLLLAGGNAVLQLRSEKLMGLKIPYVALASGWGSKGFFLSTGMIFIFDIFGLAGIAAAFKHR